MTEQPYKVHLSEDGVPRECNANIADCPVKNSDGSPVEHFSSKEEARAHYASQMESRAHSTIRKRSTKGAKLDENLYISVLDRPDEVVFEGYPDMLARSLQPGSYTAMYHDEKTDSSRYIRMSVSDSGEITYKQLSRFQATTSVASLSIQNAVSNLKSDLEELSKRSDPSTCKRDHMDRITLMDATQRIKRHVAIHDWSSATGASRGRANLEDVEWDLEHDIAVAEEQGNITEANAIRESQSVLSKFIQSTK